MTRTVTRTRQGYTYRRCAADGRTVPTDRRRCTCGGTRFVWAYRVDIGIGTRKQVGRSGFATKAEALAALAEAQRRAADPNSIEPARVTTGEYLDRWLDGMRTRIAGSTWRSYEGAFRLHLKPRIGDVPLQGLTRSHVLAALTSIEQTGTAPKTVRNVALALRRALRDAEVDRLIIRNPAAFVRGDLPVQRRVRADGTTAMQVWDKEQVAAFLRATAVDRDAALWRLLVTTGMRRGEALGLRRADVDYGRHTVSISQSRVRGASGIETRGPKTASGRRQVDVDPATAEMLRAHVAAQRVVPTSGLIFTRPDGVALDPDVVSQRFDALAQAAGLPRIRLHDLRHTHATLLLQAGVPVKVVSERLGHANVQITLDTYAHVMPGMGRDAATAMAQIIAGASA